MQDSYYGVIQALGFQFAPLNWAYCIGTSLAVAQYSALYSLIGDMYGGSGQVSFNLPDLRGRAAMGQGQGPATFNRLIGQYLGSESSALTSDQLPSHTHIHTYAGGGGGGDDMTITIANVPGKNLAPDAGDFIAAPGTPTGAVAARAFLSPAQIQAGTTRVLGGTSGGSAGGFDNASFTIDINGGSQPIPLMQPAQVVNFCICTNGLYPVRS